MCDNDVILKRQQVFIPQEQRKYILEILHTAHQGIEKTRLLARIYVYWPGMNEDISKMISQCSECQETSRRQSREPLQIRDTPKRPWQHIATDLFELQREHYLLIIDYYSKYPFVYKMNNACTSTNVINILKKLFAEQGVPETLMSDNGRQYSSTEFAEFTKSWNFKHITSSPYNPRSNGLAERTVQTIKRTLIKTNDPYKALLLLRATPIDAHLRSPAELLYNRRLTTILPTTLHDSLDTRTRNRLTARSKDMKYYHDKGIPNNILRELQPNEPINARNPITNRWSPSTVVSRRIEP